jgi:hypothetical protein
VEVLEHLRRRRRAEHLADVVERVHHDRERVAQLVCDACGELPDGGHLLGLDQLALEALAIGDVDAHQLV